MERSRLAGSVVAALGLALGACGGGGNSADPVGTAPPPPGTNDSGCTGSCVNATSFLTTADVGEVIAQAVNEAQAQGARATIAVVDRVGNVLGVYRMSGAGVDVTITSNRGVVGGLEGAAIIPSELAAISKAVTGAFLSSEGNAFTTRTASQIVQQHFNPGESNAPSGPLFGVQFSQFVCSDLITLPAPTLGLLGVTGALTTGPKPAPLGLSADPGGLPLYKAGTPVGGVGAIADGTYSLDLRIIDFDRDVDEMIAIAGTFDFGAPVDRRAEAITADAKTFRYSDVGFSDLGRDPASAPGFATLGPGTGALIDVPLFFVAANGLQQGTVFTQPASGVRADDQFYSGRDAFVLVDNNNRNRFPPTAGNGAGADSLTATEVQEVLSQAIGVANMSRAQIRRPFDSQMRVSVSVIDFDGDILGVARTRDAPIFGLDVSLQKARSSLVFSSNLAADLAPLPNAIYINANGTPSGTQIVLSSYVAASRDFFGNPTLFGDSAIAFTPRAVGNIARPYFPDGLIGTQFGPLSKPFDSWSPFTDGIQLDLVLNAALSTVVAYRGLRDGSLTVAQAVPLIPVNGRCVGWNLANPAASVNVKRMANGIQIFPGSVPIYRGNRLIGAVGVSGDGIDQDDMIASLGLLRAGQQLGSIGHAPANMRSDTQVPRGARLRYVQCPQAPFLNSTDQNVCGGL